MTSLRAVVVAVLVVLSAAGLCIAQDDETEAIKTVVTEFLGAAKAGNADDAGEYLAESIVFYMDLEKGVEDRAALLQNMADEPAPEGIELGDYEPKVFGDIAAAVVPLGNLSEELPDLEAAAAMVFIKQAGDWKILAMSLVTPNLMEVLPAEMKTQLEPLQEGLTAFEAQIDEVYTSGGVAELMELCTDDALVASPFDGGAVSVISALEVRQMIAGAPAMPLRRADEPDPVRAVGLAGAMLATTATTNIDGMPRLGRHIAMAVFLPDQQVWKLALVVEAVAGE